MKLSTIWNSVYPVDIPSNGGQVNVLITKVNFSDLIRLKDYRKIGGFITRATWRLIFLLLTIQEWNLQKGYSRILFEIFFPLIIWRMEKEKLSIWTQTCSLLHFLPLPVWLLI